MTSDKWAFLGSDGGAPSPASNVSSPAAAASGTWGEEDPQPIVHRLKAFSLSEWNDVCGGTIGSNGRCCLRALKPGSDNCGTNHRGGRLALRADSYLVLDKLHVGSAFCSPIITKSEVDTLDYQARQLFVAAERTLSNWNLYASSLKAAASSDDSVKALEEQLEVVAGKVPLKTPGKSTRMGSPKSYVIPEAPSPVQANTKEKWTDVPESFRARMDYVDDLSTAIAYGWRPEVVDDLCQVETRLGHLECVFGTQSEDLNLSTTMWGAISVLNDRLNSFQATAEDAVSRLKDVSDELMEAKAQNRQFAKNAEDGAQAMALLDRLNPLFRKLRFMDEGVHSSEVPVEAIRRQVHQEVEELVSSSGFFPDDHGTILGLSSRMNQVEDLVQKFNPPNQFGGVSFSNLVDAGNWLRKHIPSSKFGLFVDGISIFEYMYTLSVSTSQYAATLNDANKAGFDPLEIKILTSFQNILPAIFGCAQANSGASLPSVNTLSKWEDRRNPTTGVRAVIETGLTTAQKQIEDGIKALPIEAADLEGTVLLNACVTNSVAFVTQLLVYVTKTLKSLIDTKRRSEQDAWDLVARLIRRIFDDLRLVRVAGANVGGGGTDPSQRFHAAASALLYTVNTHRVMKSFMDHNFQNHPNIASEMVVFFTLGSDGNTDLVTKEVEELKASVKKLGFSQNQQGQKLEALDKRMGKGKVGEAKA